MSGPHAVGGSEGDVTAAMVRVVRGAPDDLELAALVAGVVAARAAMDDDEQPGGPSSAWTDHGRRLGRRHVPGPDTWRWSLHR